MLTHTHTKSLRSLRAHVHRYIHTNTHTQTHMHSQTHTYTKSFSTRKEEEREETFVWVRACVCPHTAEIWISECNLSWCTRIGTFENYGFGGRWMPLKYSFSKMPFSDYCIIWVIAHIQMHLSRPINSAWSCYNVCVCMNLCLYLVFALSRYVSMIGCLLSYFDWTSLYRGDSSKMITTQGLLKMASSATLLSWASM